MSEPPAQPEPTPGRRRRRWPRAAAALLVVCAVGATAWWFGGRQVWTDGGAIRRVADAGELREVLWTAPRPLGDAFNTEQQEYEPSVSPDGAAVYFVRGKPSHDADVYVSYRRDGAWTDPEPLASVNTEGDELGPALTPDGRFLLFYSDRAGGVGQYDIWAAPRVAGGGPGEFGEPFNLGPAVNSEFNEYGPAATPDGRGLLFATNRKSAGSEQREAWRATIRQSDSGDYDIFLAQLGAGAELPAPAPSPVPPPRGAEPATRPADRPDDTDHANAADRPALAYQPARELQGVNTPHHDGASCMSPAGDFLYFASNRPGGHGRFDLYRGRLRDGVVTAVENLGPAINTADNETDPQLAVGGFHLLFSSDGEPSRGGYDLLAAESREVYVRRDARPIPATGWSWWLLLLALAALLPLLFFLRGWDDRRLNLLQKCLLVSVLFHVVLTILFSLYNVSREIVQYVHRQQEMELSLDLRAADAEAIVSAEVRGQPRLDVPVQAPPPVEVAQAPTEIPLETLEPPAAGDLSVPQAQLDPGRMVIEVPAPPVEAAAASEVPEVVVPAPSVDAPEIAAAAMPAPAQVRAPEVPPPPVNPADDVAVARLEAPADAAAAPAAVSVGVRPTEVEVGSLAQAPGAQRAKPHADAEMVAADHQAPGAAPEVRAPPAVAPPVAAAEATAPEPGEGDAGVQRQGVAVAVDGPGAVSPDVPPAEMAAGRESLASAPPIRREPAPAPDALPVPADVAVADDRVDVELRSAVEKVAVRPAPDSAEPAQPAFPEAGRVTSSDEAGTMATEVAVAAEASRPVAQPDALETLAGPTTRPGVVESAEAPALADVALAPPDIATAGPSALPRASAAELEAAPAPAGEPALATGKVPPTTGPTDMQATSVDAAVPTARAEAAAQSLAGGAGAAPRMLSEDAFTPEASVAEAPDPSLPGAGAGAPKAASPGEPEAPPGTREDALALSVRSDVPPAVEGPEPLSIDPAADAGKPAPMKPADALTAAEVRPRADVVDISVGPQLSVTLPDLTAPEAMFQRSEAMRKPLVERMGGTTQSEEAVDRGLAYLARQQEPDGRWTRVDDDGPPGKRGRGPHDMACTGLSVLAFLAADHTPAKPGPYRDVVEKGLEFLLATQGPDGDLRGYPDRRGGGSGAANLYDHGIACLALGEAGLMTGDKRYIDAALKGAGFIVASQHRDTGGWRYTPGEPGDTSVFGWQIMALHSAEQLGFETPAATREGVQRYVKIASTGPRKTLGGYTPGSGPTPAMTAELLFARILLGDALDGADVKEASDYLARHAPHPGGDVYGWYYASLALIQMNNDAWRTWNERCRETLVNTQRKGGPADGCWDTNLKWGDHGGRIYTTALATLTLEVYYRYLPMLRKE
jgi:hypothetical protein